MTAIHDTPAHEAHGHGADNHGGADHGSVGSYTVGFILSVVLTVVPFALVMTHAASAAVVVPVCVGIGLVQMVVHLIYFLHMNAASSRSWNMIAFLFTVLIVAILVIGSLWIMYHLNANMMPGMTPTE
jgi:cytochrome o ubiquinol oxidase subunit IV